MGPSTDDAGELVALRELKQSEGWRLLVQAAEREWGPTGYGYRMQQTLASVPPGPDRPYEIARMAEQVEATAQAVNTLIKWPDERIRVLTATSQSKRPFAALRRS